MLQRRQPDFSKVPRTTNEVCNLVNCPGVITPYQHIRNCNTQVYISGQSDQVPSTTLVPFFLQALSTLLEVILCIMQLYRQVSLASYFSVSPPV